MGGTVGGAVVIVTRDCRSRWSSLRNGGGWLDEEAMLAGLLTLPTRRGAGTTVE